MKKRFQRNDLCICDYDYKEVLPKQNWVYKGTEFAGEFKDLKKGWRNEKLLYNE